MEEAQGMDFEPGLGGLTEEEKKELHEFEKNKQQKLRNLKLGLNKKTVNQLRTFNSEYLDNNYQIAQLLEE